MAGQSSADLAVVDQPQAVVALGARAARWPRRRRPGRGTGARPRGSRARARGARAARRSARAAAPGRPVASIWSWIVRPSGGCSSPVRKVSSPSITRPEPTSKMYEVWPISRASSITWARRRPDLITTSDAGPVAGLERARGEQRERRPPRCGTATPPYRGACRRGRCRRSESPLRASAQRGIRRALHELHLDQLAVGRLERRDVSRRSGGPPRAGARGPPGAPRRPSGPALAAAGGGCGAPRGPPGPSPSVPPSRSRACSSIDVSIA